MGIFGWSYPPGCSGPPEYDDNCQVCFYSVENCICPVCPKCEECGNPDCYTKHGLQKTFAQIDRQWVMDDANTAQCEAEARFYKDMEQFPEM